MNQPTPAIVAQAAVRRLPRWLLLLFCLAYIVPGFVARNPWKNDDIVAFGYMRELALGHANWLHPLLAGMPLENPGPLPYWIGAWALRLAPAWIAPDLTARLPFMALLALTLTATWYGVSYLARRSSAQPVAFAFGGEATPIDYARTIADGGLLALIACLGLAQLSHEGTTYLVQLACTTLVFFALAAAPYRVMQSSVALLLGQTGLALVGAPTLAVLFGTLGILLAWRGPDDAPPACKLRWVGTLVLSTLIATALAWWADTWAWRITMPNVNGMEWQSLGRLLLWFTWPAWPLALLTLWRWRRQIFNRESPSHLAIPLWFVIITLATTLFTQPRDRALMQGLPALATLAAFALPTLGRSLAALIDWFTLLFFSACAIAIWVIWIAVETGVPAKPAANVARLAPDFTPLFSWPAFLVALAATLAWAWLVWWRAGRHRPALWKSLVLPAGGTALNWLLMMSIWLPLLDHGRSYVPLVQSAMAIWGPQQPTCVQTLGLSRSQVAAFAYHGDLRLEPASKQANCPWLVADSDALPALPIVINARQWVQRADLRRPTDRSERVVIFQRVQP